MITMNRDRDKVSKTEKKDESAKPAPANIDGDNGANQTIETDFKPFDAFEEHGIRRD